MGKKILAVWICLALAITTAVYLFTFQERLRLNLDRFAHTQEILSLVNDLEANLAEAVALARGFVIAGEPEQLQGYPEARKAIDATFARLVYMTAAEPEQQRLLGSLRPLIDQRMSLLERAIDVRRQGGDAGELIALAQAGAKVDAKIQKILDEMEHTEKRLLDPERAKEKKKTRTWLWVLTFGTFLSFTFLLGFLYLLNKEVAERRRAEEKLLAYQADLRSLASKLTLAEEHERRRIAGYLHDQIGHTLALANIKLNELQKVASQEMELTPIG